MANRSAPGRMATKAWRRWWSATTARKWSIVWPIPCFPASMAAKPRNSVCARCCPGSSKWNRSMAAWGAACWQRARTWKPRNRFARFSPLSKGECSNCPDACGSQAFAASVAGKYSRRGGAATRARMGCLRGICVRHFDAVIVATPAPAAGPLLEITSAHLASELKSIPYSSSMTVALGFDKDVRAALAARLWLSGAAQRRQTHAGRNLCSQ